MIPLRELYERDGGQCWICAGIVLWGLDPDSPRSASRDHVIPRSRGGTNARKNLRLAHRECNSDRGNPTPRPVPLTHTIGEAFT